MGVTVPTPVTYEYINTSQLRHGDVVRVYGMRLLIDQPINQVTRDGRIVYFTAARVLNEEEAVSEYGIPRLWLREERWVEGEGWRIDPADVPRWDVQGNDWAKWTVERPAFGPSGRPAHPALVARSHPHEERHRDRLTPAELRAADLVDLDPWESAWRDYFRAHPDVLANRGHQNGHWPSGYGDGHTTPV